MVKTCCDLSSGLLREEIELQSKGNTRRAGGGMTTTFTTYATVRAMITPKRASEFARAMKLEQHTTHEIAIRYSPDLSISVGHRVKFGSRYFHITGLMNLEEANKWFIVSCSENPEAAA
jgi:SPP1 family predicted phage head-tail adaptor